MPLPPRAIVALLGVRLAGALLHSAEAGLAGDARPVDVVADLWEGLDVPDGDDWPQDAQKVLVTPRRQAVAKRSLDSRERMLALLGPFDSGTNLLIRTLKANYKVPEVHLWKHGMNISDSPNNQGGAPLYEVLQRRGVRVEDTVVVMLVRSPLATMLAWKKASYDLYSCARRPLESFDRPCRAMRMQWNGTGEHDVSALSRFASTMDVYNQYMRMYRAIQREGRAHAAVLVTYEDLVYSPGDVVNAIAGAMGWPQRTSVAIVDRAAKTHGDAHGRGMALERLRRRDWLQKISRAVRKAMCRDLDRGAVEGIVDNSYSSEEPSKAYAADCEGFGASAEPGGDRGVATPGLAAEDPAEGAEGDVQGPRHWHPRGHQRHLPQQGGAVEGLRR